MHLKDAAHNYMTFLRHEQRATATTVKTYQSGLNSFIRWMEENVKPDPTLFDFSTPVLRRYLYFHSEQGLRPRTLRGRFHPIKGLAAFLVKNQALKADPSAAIQMPKKDPAQRLTVSEAEVCALFAAVERLASARKVALCRAILSVLCMSGLRRQELLDLHMSDYDTQEGGLHVRHGKGDKARLVYMPEVACQAIDEWLRLRPANTLPFLFVIDTRRRVGQEALRALVEEIKAVAGLRGAPNIKPHSLRHFYASHLVRSGADLESVRVLLGHADMRTTQIYVHADRDRLKAVAELAADSATSKAPHPPEATPLRGLGRTDDRDRERPRLRRIAR